VEVERIAARATRGGAVLRACLPRDGRVHRAEAGRYHGARGVRNRYSVHAPALRAMGPPHFSWRHRTGGGNEGRHQNMLVLHFKSPRGGIDAVREGGSGKRSAFDAIAADPGQLMKGQRRQVISTAL